MPRPHSGVPLAPSATIQADLECDPPYGLCISNARYVSLCVFTPGSRVDEERDRVLKLKNVSPSSAALIASRWNRGSGSQSSGSPQIRNLRTKESSNASGEPDAAAGLYRDDSYVPSLHEVVHGLRDQVIHAHTYGYR